jgi:tetratricopeptide (TPR) repeat protein
VHPHYLMYFNFLAGGPDQGWRISVNGDDWGQGDRALARWLSERGVNKVAYAGFGGWGVDQLSQYHIKVKGIPCSDNGELVAFHVNMLISTSTVANAQCFEWLKQKKPDAKIGYNIFLYNINSVSRFPRPAPPANLTLFQQALDLQKRGENAQAIALYRQYLMQEPDYYQAHFNLAYALMETGQCAAAIPEFERTLALWPGYDEVKIHLAQCRLALDKKSDATPGAMPATP